MTQDLVRGLSSRAGFDDFDLLRTLVENLPDHVFVKDVEGRFILNNAEHLLALGASVQEEVTGKSDLDFYPEKLAARHRADEQEIVRTGRSLIDQEEPVRDESGGERWLSTTRVPLRDGSGMIVGILGVSRDITERRRAETALQRSEKSLAEAQRIAHIGNWEYEVEEDQARWSDEMYRIFGFSPGEFVPRYKAFLGLVHPEDKGFIRRAVREALYGGGQRSIEYRIVRPNGVVRSVYTEYEVLCDESGKPRRLFGTVHDITERKQAEERLREAEARYRTLVEQIPAVTYIDRPDNTSVYTSPQIEAMLGYTTDEWLATDLWMERLHPGDQEWVLAADDRSKAKGEPFGYEYRLLARDGRVVWVQDEAVLLRDEAGEPWLWQGILLDITARKRAEAALQESERRFRQLFERSTDALLVHDEHGRMVDCNSEACHSLGYTREELLELSVKDFATDLLSEGEKTRRGDAPWKRAMTAEPGTVVGYHENEHRRKDGTTFPVEVGIGAIEYGGRRLIFASARDLTERKRTEEALKESEERYRAAEEGSLDAFFLLRSVRDEAGNITDFTFIDLNSRAEELISMPKEEVIGEKLCELLPINRTGGFLEKYARVVETREALQEEFSISAPEIKASWLHHQVVPVGDGVAITSRDITERKEAETKLREAETRYRTLTEQIPAVTYIKGVGDARHYSYISPQMEEMLGYTPEERTANSDHWTRTLHPDDRERVLAERERVTQTGEVFKTEYRQFAKDGREVWVRDEAVLLRDEEGNPLYWQGILTDITERKNLEERLRHRAFHDSLTGLPNRALFLELLRNALVRAGRDRKSVAVLFVDLDNFKVVNDSLGHPAGNELLESVAENLRACVRPGDTVARFFGDEFAVLLESVSSVSEATRVADRIAEKLRMPFVSKDREVSVGASIGIDLSTADQKEPDELLRNADLAMYAAKGKGKARYEVFAPSMNTRLLERMDLGNDLRRAVEREELAVYYQPIVALETGAIEGLEALVRWQHPQRGLITPSEFIPVAEQTGVILQIGRWVLEETRRQIREWQSQLREGVLPPISVNLSAKQFLNEPGFVLEALQDDGLDPSCLRLEITERVVMDDAEFAIDKIQRLKGLGIRFAIDDFGTGYSCLHYLKRLPVDQLKIDRSFIEGLEENAEDVAIVSGTISLAQALGLQVVAEGVETAEQLALLREMGCDLVQGNHLSEPLPGETAKRFLLARYLPVSAPAP